MAPLITELWGLGYITNLACQDASEAVLVVKHVRDVERRCSPDIIG
jgi:hypothetical protein